MTRYIYREEPLTPERAQEIRDREIEYARQERDDLIEQLNDDL